MFRFLFIILWISNAMTFAQNVEVGNMQELNDFVNAFDLAWNTHNSAATASLWVEDGDIMTPWGQWIRGRGQIGKYFEKEKTGPYGKSTIQLSTDASRFLSSQLALVDATVSMNGIVDSKGAMLPALLQHVVFLLAKVDNRWKIISARIYHFERPQIE